MPLTAICGIAGLIIAFGCLNAAAQTGEEAARKVKVIRDPAGGAIYMGDVDRLAGWLHLDGDPDRVLEGRPLLHWAVHFAPKQAEPEAEAKAEANPEAAQPEPAPPVFENTPEPTAFDDPSEPNPFGKGIPADPFGGPDPFAESVKTDSENSLKIVKLLLDRGASADALNQKQETALQVAVAKGSFYLAAPLLKAGAAPDRKDAEGFTPLHRTAMDGDEATVAALLDAGADPNAEVEDGKTPLLFAAVDRKPSRLRPLEKGRWKG